MSIHFSTTGTSILPSCLDNLSMVDHPLQSFPVTFHAKQLSNITLPACQERQLWKIKDPIENKKTHLSNGPHFPLTKKKNTPMTSTLTSTQIQKPTYIKFHNINPFDDVVFVNQLAENNENIQTLMSSLPLTPFPFPNS